MLVLNASDFLFFNISLSQYGEVMFWWSTLTVLYLLFWFAVSYLILSLKKSAVITALIQISVWLFFVAVFPGVVIAYASVRTEQLLTRISGNDLDSYMDFFRQVDSYQKQWQGFLYPYHFRDEHLDSSDFYKFPVFHYQKSKMFLREARNVCFGLFLFSLLMTVSANFLSRSPDLSTR